MSWLLILDEIGSIVDFLYAINWLLCAQMSFDLFVVIRWLCVVLIKDLFIFLVLIIYSLACWVFEESNDTCKFMSICAMSIGTTLRYYYILMETTIHYLIYCFSASKGFWQKAPLFVYLLNVSNQEYTFGFYVMKTNVFGTDQITGSQSRRFKVNKSAKFKR